MLTDLLNAALDLGGFSGALDDCGVVSVYGHLLGAAKILDLHVFELDPEVHGDGFTTGQCCDVFEHGLAAVAEARGFDGGALQRAAKLVNDKSRKSFAFDFFRDDQERLAHLGDTFEQGQQVLHGANFIFVDQDANVFEYALHALRIGDEVR